MELKPSCLREDICGEVCKLLTDTYLDVEPMTSVIDISREDFYRYAQTSFQSSLTDGFATGVKSNGVLVGLFLCKDYHSHQSRETVLGSCFGPIQNLMSSHAPYTPRYLGEKVLYCSNLAVKSEFTGKGIAKMMIEHVFDLSRDLGYTKALAECNSIQSQKIFEKSYSPRLLNYVDFASFEYEAKCVFSSIADHGGSKLYEVDLSRLKSSAVA